MKRLSLALLGALLISAAPQDTPVNSKCPMMNKPVKANFTSTYNGQTVGFC